MRLNFTRPYFRYVYSYTTHITILQNELYRARTRILDDWRMLLPGHPNNAEAASNDIARGILRMGYAALPNIVERPMSRFASRCE